MTDLASRAAVDLASRAAVLVRCVRALAAFDLVVTGCLAVPPFARAFLALALDSRAPPGVGLAAFGPLQLLFVHLAGVLGVLWALARLRSPTPELALLDVGGRLAVAALILYATSATGMTPLLHFFVGSETLGAGLQYWAVRRTHALRRA